MEKEKIIDEFIKGSQLYIETLRLMRNDGMCPICGMKAESYEKLVEAVKKLKEKAWKYDDLCK